MARFVFLLVLALSAATLPAASVQAATASAAQGGVQVQLGPEQRVVGPTSMMDSPYFAERAPSGRILGYLSNQTTYAYDADRGRLAGGRVALSRGPGGSFDACGAWLNSVHQVTATHWVGWYHAEGPGSGMNGRCVNGHNVWRVAFAESTDGGHTWQKPNYRANPTASSPGNLVISQSTSFLMTDKVGTDAGNPRVIQAGSYLYALYQATGVGATYSGPNHGVNIARAPVSSLGKPGSWRKYYCPNPLLPILPANCSWSQPGVGGLSSSVSNLPAAARFITWNTYLGRYVGLQASGRSGFSLRFSAGGDVLSWPAAATVYPAVSTASDTNVDDWVGRTRASKQLYGYPSLVGAYGGSAATGRVFYLYYMKIYPGDAFGRRFLFRRQVTLVKTPNTPLNRVQLTTYRDAKGRRRSTTEQPKLQGYRRVGSAGNLLTTARAGWKDVFECSSGHGDAFLQVSRCSAGHPAVRRVGFISPRRTSVATVPIYRCYDGSKRRHFASTSQRCSGKRREYRLGFGLATLR